MTNTKFEEEYQQLNATQQKAVDQIFGPVVVIAGPGTGKTQILSMRIGNILKQTDADPHNILCLTYTEAGTVAMRKRLTSMIGPESYNIHISTFHGFCNRIIMDYSELFSAHNDLRAIDDLERMDLFVDMIDNWPADHILKNLKGESYYIIPTLKNFFGTMKSEGWTTEEVIRAADDYIASLPFRDEFIYKRKTKTAVKGDLKQGEIDKVTKQMERLKAGARAFDEFEAIMRTHGRFDYADMILWVRDAIRSDVDLRYNLQEQYQFILVDEYQDTNGAQNDLLYLLCGDPEDQPNIFAVGDDDQAIYRFQGANLTNIEEFIKKWSQELFHVILTDNYRSSQGILDTADALIDNNKERLTNSDELISFNKRLIASGEKNSQFTTGVLLSEFDTETEELIGIKQYIDQAIAKGVEPNEIAVLFRKWKHVQPLIKFFQSEKIHHQIKRATNVLVDPFI